MGDRRVLFALALCGAVISGCARPDPPRALSTEHYVITEAELQRVSDLTLYDAVRTLRPHFLRSRAVTAHGRPGYPLMLYVDGDKMESIDHLRSLWPAAVAEVRFYEPQLANTRFGMYNNAGGAVAVILKRMVDPSDLDP